MTIEINDPFRWAFDAMESGSGHCFITGKAGTGKSTLLSYFRDRTRLSVAVLAPTGVAALNVGGQTVHSFFGFLPDVTVQKARRAAQSVLRAHEEEIYAKLDAVVLDEVSMVRADLFDCVDAFLRTVRGRKKAPFGGVRMILIGDLYQLPPVVRATDREIFEEHYASPHFFDAKAFPSLDLEVFELEKIYRQKDDRFIELLNAVRNNTVTEDHIGLLNGRVEAELDPDRGFPVFLTGTNRQAAQVNQQQLAKLPGRASAFEGLVEGDLDRSQLPTEPKLYLKEEAQVMLLNNDPSGRWVNGTMARVVSLPEEGREADGDEAPAVPAIEVELEGGRVEAVLPHRWDVFRYAYDRGRKSLVTETVGTFTQYPLKLAWAVTIHKAQGKTFDQAVIDVGHGMFAPGQMYVALSRCRSLNGLSLTRPVKREHVFVDRRIVSFLTEFHYRRSEEAMPLSGKTALIERAIGEGKSLEIVYLKASDEKSRRVVRPLSIGPMEYQGKEFLGFRAYCEKRGEERTFRVDRILEMRVVR